MSESVPKSIPKSFHDTQESIQGSFLERGKRKTRTENITLYKVLAGKNLSKGRYYLKRGSKTNLEATKDEEGWSQSHRKVAEMPRCYHCSAEVHNLT